MDFRIHFSCVVFAPSSHKSVRPSVLHSERDSTVLLPPSGECEPGPSRAEPSRSVFVCCSCCCVCVFRFVALEASTSPRLSRGCSGVCAAPLADVSAPLPGYFFSPLSEPPFWADWRQQKPGRDPLSRPWRPAPPALLRAVELVFACCLHCPAAAGCCCCCELHFS